jgi:hypothetical protein
VSFIFLQTVIKSNLIFLLLLILPEEFPPSERMQLVGKIWRDLSSENS